MASEDTSKKLGAGQVAPAPDKDVVTPVAPAPGDEGQPRMVKVKVATEVPVDGHRQGEEFEMREDYVPIFKKDGLVEEVKP